MENNSNPASTAATAATASQSSAPAPAAPVVPDNTIRVEGVLDIDLQKGGNGQLLDRTKYANAAPPMSSCPRS